MTTTPKSDESPLQARAPRVLLAEKPNERIDLTKAKAFGDIHVLLTEDDPSCFSSDAYMTTLKTRLHEFDFNPNIDYFCVAGPAANIALVFAALVREHKVVRALLYSPGANGYLSRTFDYRAFAL